MLPCFCKGIDLQRSACDNPYKYLTVDMRCKGQVKMTDCINDDFIQPFMQDDIFITTDGLHSLPALSAAVLTAHVPSTPPLFVLT